MCWAQWCVGGVGGLGFLGLEQSRCNGTPRVGPHQVLLGMFHAADVIRVSPMGGQDTCVLQMRKPRWICRD